VQNKVLNANLGARLFILIARIDEQPLKVRFPGEKKEPLMVQHQRLSLDNQALILRNQAASNVRTTAMKKTMDQFMTILTEPPSKKPKHLSKRGVTLGVTIFLGLVVRLILLPLSPISSSTQVGRVDYERIQPGMTQIQVEATLPPGVEVSRSKESTQLVWENPDGSKIEAEFQNGILTSKAQSGLK